MQRIRQTIINDYYLCGYKALLNWGAVGEVGKYELEENPQNKYSATGIAIHETMETWGTNKMANVYFDTAEYHGLLDHNIDKLCTDELFEEGEKETFRISLHEQLDWLMEQTNSSEILAVEWQFEVNGIFDGVNEPIFGTVDRIDGNLEAKRVSLIDYKSGKTFTKKKLSTNVQALFYSLAFNAMYGFLPETFVFYFSKHRKKQIIYITEEFLNRAAAEFLSAYYKMAEGEYVTKGIDGKEPNKFFCQNFCEHYKECPRYKKARKNNAWDIRQEVFNEKVNL